ncbi:MAG: Type 1 glutamine amidotransferase-like domain-containing protein [Flavobacteriales bacterium]|nr:Type 1 glutamine amidotransferase-like domain-containing protein [Flavobacteriales bacterium]
MKSIVLSALLVLPLFTVAQDYTSYFTGNQTGIETTPAGGACLMGGASESDEAMIWFLEQANGGDVLVLRASGSDGYNDYFYSELGVSVNSVETIVFSSAAASFDTYVHEKIAGAEAIWFAGGDQWNYVNYWRNTPVQDLINSAISDRNVVIGGTSAGMAILGEYYFSAQNGTISSTAALNNPYNANVTVDNSAFLDIPFMENVVTDTHYDNPDRRGRHVAFMARVMTDYSANPKGIASEEYTAVCVDANGIARVFGGFPQYEDYAYFIQTNCELADASPETCEPGSNLVWSHNNAALNVLKVPGTTTGEYFLDLNNWETSNVDAWQKWYVNNANLGSVDSTAPNCSVLVDETEMSFSIGPNPTADIISINSDNVLRIECYNLFGQLVLAEKGKKEISMRNLENGNYILRVITTTGEKHFPVLKID